MHTAVTSLLAPDDTRAFEGILSLVAERRGLDLRLYRRAMIERRVLARARLAGVRGPAEYLQRLQHSEAELDHLIAYVTIKVSQFYRNAAVFDLVRHRVIPDLLGRQPARPLRLWSAGCGRGEEAYTLTMLLSEAEGAGAPTGSTVLATDVDGLALAAARQGRYPLAALAELPSEMAAAHLTVEGQGAAAGATVSAALRQRVRFVQHNLLAATAPLSGLRFDIICCRNVLIYFQRAEQAQVQRSLLECLAPGGYLVLGEAEMLASDLGQHMEAIDRRARVYRRTVASKGNQR